MAKRQENRDSDNGTSHETETEYGDLKAIFDSINDGIYIVGKDYRIKFMNLALRSEIGDGEGLYCYDLFGRERSSCEECQLGMGSFGPHLRREWFLPKTKKTFDMAITPMHEPDGTVSRLHILRDITERKRLEAQLQEYSQKLEAKVAEQSERLLRRERLTLLGEISAGLAHEIRTPLGAIMTGIKLLEGGRQASEERDLIFGLLKRETARLERKLSEFLTYAKHRLPQWTETNVSSLLEEIKIVLSTDRQLVGGVAIKVTVDPKTTVWVLDSDQIKEALLNIGMNALQALGGAGALALEARSNRDTLEIIVRDNGPGISPDALPYIFRPFYSKRSDGTGLGLAITKERVECQGGKVTVTSIPGLNTTFKIILQRPKRQSA